MENIQKEDNKSQVIPASPDIKKPSINKNILIAVIVLIIIVFAFFAILFQQFSAKKTLERQIPAKQRAAQSEFLLISFSDCVKSQHIYQQITEKEVNEKEDKKDKEVSGSARQSEKKQKDEKEDDIVQDCRWAAGEYKEEVKFKEIEATGSAMATESAIPIIISEDKQKPEPDKPNPKVDDFSYYQVVMPSGNTANNWTPVLDSFYKFRFSYPKFTEYSSAGGRKTITSHGKGIKSGSIHIDADNFLYAFDVDFSRVDSLPNNSAVSDVVSVFPKEFTKTESKEVDNYKAIEITAADDNNQKIFGTIVNRDGQRLYIWTSDENLIGLKSDIVSSVVFLDNRKDLVPLRNSDWKLYEDESFAFHRPAEWNLESINETDNDSADNSAHGKRLIITDKSGNNGIHIRTRYKGQICNDKQCAIRSYKTASGLQGKVYTWQGGVYYIINMDDGSQLFAEPIYGTLFESINTVVDTLYIPDKASPVKIEQITANVTPESAQSCPAVFTFSGTITASGEGIVLYKWFRSDSGVGPFEFLNVNGSNIYSVQTTWTLNPKKFSGWEKLETLSPAHQISEPVNFTLEC